MNLNILHTLKRNTEKLKESPTQYFIHLKIISPLAFELNLVLERSMELLERNQLLI